VTDELTRPGRRAVGEWALEQLYSDIFSGRLQAGAEVGEVELAERLQVSRSPIRDALRQLEFDGLVVPGARNGLRVVKSFGHQDIAELYDVRASLEALAFARAADLRTDQDLAVLAGIQQESEADEQASAWAAAGSTPTSHFTARCAG
jgi:DNA-binding GntR family transcriptional regulator